MILYDPLLCLDFYKTAHAEQYPQTLTKMVSYYTPRMTRLADTDKVTMFGLQAFINEYLIDSFNPNFFWIEWSDVLADYRRVLNATINMDGVGEKRLKALHDLRYLPLEIRAVPEGTRTDIKVLQIEISNTNPDFVWLVNSIETMLSCTMWHTQISAEVDYRYRQIVNEFAECTCDDSVVCARLLGDFSMRGQESVERPSVQRHSVEEVYAAIKSHDVAAIRPMMKPTFGSVELGEFLRDKSRNEVIEEIVLIGLCTDICVISNALLIKAFLPEVKVTVDAACCAGVTLESHNNALKAMRMCQVNIENWEDRR